MNANANIRILLMVCGIMLVVCFWLPWIRLNQMNMIQGVSSLNGLNIVDAFNHYRGTSLRLPMYIGLVNGFLLVPFTGAGLCFSALINHRWGCIFFGVLCCGMLNLFWAASYFAVSQDSVLLQLFDPLAELAVGYILICPLTVLGIVGSTYFLNNNIEINDKKPA